MATSILDAFVVTFAIDASKYKSGERDLRDTLKKTKQDAKSTFDEVESRAKNSGDSIRQLTNQVAGLFIAFTGARTITQFAKDLVTSQANAKRLGETLGMSASRLNAWEHAIGDVGGQAGDADAALSKLQDTIMGWRLNPSGMNPGLLAFGIGPSDMTTAEHLLMKLAEGRSKFSPQEYASRLQMLGMPQGMIYMLEQGTAKVREAVRWHEKHAKVTDESANAAARLQKSLNRLSTDLEGGFLPGLTRMVKGLDRVLSGVERLIDLLPDLTGKWQEFTGSGDGGHDNFFDPIRKALKLKTGADARRDGTDIFGRPNPQSAAGRATGTWDGTTITVERHDGKRAPRPSAPRSASTPQSVADRVFEQLIIQESGGKPGRTGPMTRWGRAHGLTQLLDSTGEDMARKLGVEWQPKLLREKTPEAAAYQRLLGRAYFDEGLTKFGSILNALRYYHGGPNQSLWGQKTNGYAASIIGALPTMHQTAHRSSSVHIGHVTVSTRATDAHGIARDLTHHLRRRAMVAAADGGLAP